MKKQIIILDSITYAYKARDYLYNKGIKAYVERIPANLRVNGCGYGVRVNGDTKSAVALLNHEGINVKGVIEF